MLTAKFLVKLHNGTSFEVNHLENVCQNSGTEGRLPMLSFISNGERRVVHEATVAEVLWLPSSTPVKTV